MTGPIADTCPSVSIYIEVATGLRKALSCATRENASFSLFLDEVGHTRACTRTLGERATTRRRRYPRRLRRDIFTHVSVVLLVVILRQTRREDEQVTKILLLFRNSELRGHSASRLSKYCAKLACVYFTVLSVIASSDKNKSFS